MSLLEHVCSHIEVYRTKGALGVDGEAQKKPKGCQKVLVTCETGRVEAAEWVAAAGAAWQPRMRWPVETRHGP